MRIDKDIQGMSLGRRGEEIQRLRNALRTHKKKRNHARCWKADADLYDIALPEGSEGMGRMDLPKEVLLAGCSRYINGQQRRLPLTVISKSVS